VTHSVVAPEGAVDPLAGWVARRAGGLLAAFTAGGVLHAADVHVAQRLAHLGGETREEVLLATALAVRAVRHGSVRVRLADAAASVVADEADPERLITAELPWPDPTTWLDSLRDSPLVTEHTGSAEAVAVEVPGDLRPLHLWGDDLWLERYWRMEATVAADLIERVSSAPVVDDAALDRVLDRLWPRPAAGPDIDEDQRAAARTCIHSNVSILGGGPGTGKTTTVARVLAALRELSAAHAQPSIALAAPTGKAAARLQEAIAAAAGDSNLATDDREFLGSLTASTVHRLIGAYRSSGRSRYHADNKLPFDIVVVDEASMLALGLFHRLLVALRPGTRLLLVGDPEQLASVEAGAVLADLSSVAPGTPVAAGISRLRVNRRSGDQGQLTTLASALKAGSADEVLAALRETDSAVRWIEVDDEQPIPEHAAAALRTRILDLAGDLLPAARSGDAVAAVAVLERHRLLCAHRRGPRGVRFWTAQVRRWLADFDAQIPLGFADRYAGLPLIVTANDYENQLWNGDTGVVIARGDDLVAAFSRGASPLELPIGRVGHAVPMHAMTVHRSQGSEFDSVTVLLPVANSPLATREMLYTAVTRARRQVTLIGSEAAVRSCVGRQAQRATGLGRRLQP